MPEPRSGQFFSLGWSDSERESGFGERGQCSKHLCTKITNKDWFGYVVVECPTRTIVLVSSEKGLKSKVD